MMNYITNIAGTWRIQDSPIVRFRLFQLRNKDDIDYEILDSIHRNCRRTVRQTLEISALEYVRTHEEV